MQTVDHLLADAVSGRITAAKGSPDDLIGILRGRGVRMTTWQDWQQIDKVETARGAEVGKPREKVTRVGEMLEILE